MIWTARQRVVLWAVTAGVLLLLAARYLLNPSPIPDPPPDESPRAAELADRIDPNTADRPALAALPVIGPNLAQRIIAYRDAFLAANPGQTAFTRLDDLRHVKGIGPATLRALEPHLIFPPGPATRP